MSKVILEYVWLDGERGFRSKYRTVEKASDGNVAIDRWNFDGSSCFLADTANSEVILNPVSSFPNPFFGNGEAYLVLCDTYYERDGKFVPTPSNFRIHALSLFQNRSELDPWFGLEQEYFLMTKNETHNTNTPLSFSGSKTVPQEQGRYYCGVGAQHMNMRELVEKHYLYCLKAGIKVSGVNAEVAPDQWEFQIGPCMGIEAGDHLWMARYIMTKLTEEYGVVVSWVPKPIPNPWNGSGLHCNFSTTETRAEGGLEAIERYIANMEPKHAEHLAVYGDNKERLSGLCETSSIDKFTFGIGSRTTSVRIPKDTFQNKCGYFEDRRPASDGDPYQITGILFKTCCL